MSYPARVFRIMIASPSDVNEEREIAVKTIQEWNDLNSAERQLVLLPLRWETHSVPEYGKRPQDILNRQVVDQCDLLVGIFWTRVGSPTGSSDSGTIEEIERVASKGKPVMLYFSQGKQDPEKIDIDQLAKLREFKKKTFPNALVEHYVGPIDFRDKLSKQIEMQLRSLLAEQTDRDADSTTSLPVTDIVLHFADPEKGTDLGTQYTLDTKYIEIADFDQVPDYVQEKPKKKALDIEEKGISTWVTIAGGSSDTNKDYYRQRMTSLVLKNYFRPVRFWLKNRGGVGARDVYISLDIKTADGNCLVISKKHFPSSQPSTEKNVFSLIGERHPVDPAEIIVEGSDIWNTQLEVPALQPQRELSPEVEFLVGSSATVTITVTARIYADTLSEPATQSLKLQLNVLKLSLTAKDILDFESNRVEKQR